MKKFLLLLTFIMSQGLIAAPIHDAARSGNLGELERILSQDFVSRYLSGNDVNAVDEEGLTPLYIAARGGHAEIVEILIIRGANVHAVDEEVL